MKFSNLKEAEKALLPFMPSVSTVTGRDITLERMWPMMRVLGNPEKKLKIIHIAGTSGKTSTAYYLSSLMATTGKKIGLHVSPHVDKITERFQINTAPISDEQFCCELAKFLDIIHTNNLQPTYFELLVAFAYWFFDREHVDYVVMETGMGGLHDGTNVAQNPDKLCVITDIGLDHMKVLGHTIPEIAYQKAGIIHPHNRVFMYLQSPEVMRVVTDKCTSVIAELLTTTESDERAVDKDLLDLTLPVYQQRNWMLAYFVMRQVVKLDGLPTPLHQTIADTQHTKIPARMDIVKLKNKTLIMDGAHNEQKMAAFVSSFQALYPGRKCAVLLSLKQDKEHKGVISQLAQIASEIITTSFKTSQELPAVSMDADTLTADCKLAGLSNTVSIPDIHSAYLTLLRSEEDILVVTGSFYLIYQLRSLEKLT